MMTTTSRKERSWLEKLKSSYHFYAFLTIIFWSGASTFTKVALTAFDPMALALTRYVVSSLLLFATLPFKPVRLPERRDMPMFVLSGLLGFTLYMFLFNKGSGPLSATLGPLIIATTPVITAVLAALVFKERIPVLGWVAVGIEFAGIAIFTLGGGGEFNAGVWWMLAAAFVLSIYNLIQRFITRKYDAFDATAIAIWVGTVPMFIALPGAMSSLAHAGAGVLLAVLFLGIFPGCVSFILWSKALSLAKKTADVTNYMFITPFFSAILGYIVIFEVPDMKTVVGGAVILIGLAMFRRSDNRA